ADAAPGAALLLLLLGLVRGLGGVQFARFAFAGLTLALVLFLAAGLQRLGELLRARFFVARHAFAAFDLDGRLLFDDPAVLAGDRCRRREAHAAQARLAGLIDRQRRVRAGGEDRFEGFDRRVGPCVEGRGRDPVFDVGLSVEDQQDAFALEHELHVREGRAAVGDEVGGTRERVFQHGRVHDRVPDVRAFAAGRAGDRGRVEQRVRAGFLDRRQARGQRLGDHQARFAEVRLAVRGGDPDDEADAVVFAERVAGADRPLRFEGQARAGGYAERGFGGGQ